jgi:F420-non-reducing hydrogenase small subunit
VWIPFPQAVPPVPVDAKVRDVEKMPDGSIDVCLFNGGIRTSEQEYMARLLRTKSKVLVAFGSCAHEGCIPGLANATDRRRIFDTVYRDTPSTENPERIWDAITAIVERKLPPPGSVIGAETPVCQECPL